VFNYLGVIPLSYPPTAAIARTAALILHVNVIFVLLPVCRNLVSSLRRTALKHFVPFDEAIRLHMMIGWTMVLGVAIHTLAHLVNFGKLAAATPDLSAGQRFSAFLSMNFLSGPGATGWAMVILLGIMVAYSSEFKRKTNYEAFWYTHHLFVVLFVIWQLHGMFCMIKPDRPPYCSFNSIGVFWVRHRTAVLLPRCSELSL
jgi:NADPH oxidase 2